MTHKTNRCRTSVYNYTEMVSRQFYLKTSISSQDGRELLPTFLENPRGVRSSIHRSLDVSDVKFIDRVYIGI